MPVLLPLLIACATTSAPPPASVGSAVVAAPFGTPSGVAPVSFAPLEERVNQLIADARDTDRRDRLVAARELMVGMRGKDPLAQRRVYAYLDELLRIEERQEPAPITIEGLPGGIVEEVLQAPAPSSPPPDPADLAARLGEARSALAEARYLDAERVLRGLSAPDAAALRREAVDGWARSERERAGRAFLEARQLPPGNERIASLRAVRAQLVAINERFPENGYAAAIAENLAKVDADLVAAGARP